MVGRGEYEKRGGSTRRRQGVASFVDVGVQGPRGGGWRSGELKRSERWKGGMKEGTTTGVVQGVHNIGSNYRLKWLGSGGCGNRNS